MDTVYFYSVGITGWLGIVENKLNKENTISTQPANIKVPQRYLTPSLLIILIYIYICKYIYIYTNKNQKGQTYTNIKVEAKYTSSNK